MISGAREVRKKGRLGVRDHADVVTVLPQLLDVLQRPVARPEELLVLNVRVAGGEVAIEAVAREVEHLVQPLLSHGEHSKMSEMTSGQWATTVSKIASPSILLITRICAYQMPCPVLNPKRHVFSDARQEVAVAQLDMVLRFHSRRCSCTFHTNRRRRWRNQPNRHEALKHATLLALKVNGSMVERRDESKPHP